MQILCCKLAGGGGNKRLSELFHNRDGPRLGLSRHPQPPRLRRRQQQHLLRPRLGRDRIMDKKVTTYFRESFGKPHFVFNIQSRKNIHKNQG